MRLGTALFSACLACAPLGSAHAGAAVLANPVLNPGACLWNAASLAAAVSFWPKPAPQAFSVWGGMLSNALPVPRSLDFASPAPLAAAFRAARAELPGSLYAMFEKPAQALQAVGGATQASASLVMPGMSRTGSTSAGAQALHADAPSSGLSSGRTVARALTATPASAVPAVPAEKAPARSVRGGLQSFTAELKPGSGKGVRGPGLQASADRLSRLFDGSRR